MSCRPRAALRSPATLPAASRQALKKLNESIDRARRGLELRDDSFHRGIGEAVSAASELEVARSMSGSSDAALAGAVASLRSAVTALFENFGKGALRSAKGGELSAKERAQLDKLCKQQVELKRRLAEVEAKAKKNDKRFAEGLRQIWRNSDRIYRSRDTVGDFVSAMLWMNLMHGLIWGWHWW